MLLSKEVELIVKMPIELLNDLDEFSKLAGYQDSRGLLAKFVQRELAIFYGCDVDDEKLKNIY